MSTIIQKQTVIDLLNANQKISLIREYRSCTGLGLKEAKDAIEANYNPAGIVELFAPYNEMSDDEREAEREAELKRVNDERKKIILKGMTTACNVWQDLGFGSTLEACQMVLMNLNDDSRFTKIQ